MRAGVRWEDAAGRLNFVWGRSMASESSEVLSAFLPIDTVGVCPPEHVIVPVVGILLALTIGKFARMVIKRLS